MGSKSEEYLYAYRVTNTKTGQVYEARGWQNIIKMIGLNANTNRFTMQKSKKWKVEITSDPAVWDEATYRQSLYAKSKSKYPDYELKKKKRDPLFETRKRLRLRGHKNIDGTQFTAEQHDQMLRMSCEVCGSSSKVVVDHDHITGFVRGVLCDKCNLSLGFAKDSVQILEKLQQYLINHQNERDNYLEHKTKNF